MDLGVKELGETHRIGLGRAYVKTTKVDSGGIPDQTSAGHADWLVSVMAVCLNEGGNSSEVLSPEHASERKSPGLE